MLLVFTSACATISPSKLPSGDLPNIENLIAANRYYSAVKLSGRIFIKDPIWGKGWRGTEASIVLSRPYSFRASFFSRVGGVWFFALSNHDEISISIPAKSVKEVWKRNNDGSSGIFKIGSLEVSGDDFARFVYPGLDEEWVRGGNGRFVGAVLRVTYHDVRYLIRFDNQNRLKSIEIKREKAKTVTVSYSYLEGDGLGLPEVEVLFNGRVKFDFTKVTEAKNLPDRLFQLPAP